MMRGRVALWSVLALLGIALTAACTWAVVSLAGERIGLASAPISVVRGLAPSAPAAAAKGTAPERPEPTVTRTVTIIRTTLPPTRAGTTVPAVTLTAPSAAGRPPAAGTEEGAREGARGSSAPHRDD